MELLLFYCILILHNGMSILLKEKFELIEWLFMATNLIHCRALNKEETRSISFFSILFSVSDGWMASTTN
jgi:hypothetical protein